MAQGSPRRVTKKSQTKSGTSKPSSTGISKDHKSRKSSSTSLRYSLIAFAVVVAIIGCIVYVSVERKVEKVKSNLPKSSKNEGSRPQTRQGKRHNKQTQQQKGIAGICFNY